MSKTKMKEMHSCPSCERDFSSERGMKVHHATGHGESLAKETTECDYCGCSFEYYPYQRNGNACSDCKGKAISDAKNMGETETCKECGSIVPIEPWEREWKDSFFCDMDCKAEFQKERSAKDHPSWEGGWEHWYGDDWDTKRRQALERDNFVCRLCNEGETEIGRQPDVHHIIPVRTYRDEYGNRNLANRLENLITLCPSHHQRVEKDSIDLPLTEVIANVHK